MSWRCQAPFRPSMRMPMPLAPGARARITACPPLSFPHFSAWPLTPTDLSTLATSAHSKGCVKHGQHTSNGTQGPDPMGKPRATQGLHSPPPCPTPWRKSGTKETQNKNQERGSGRRGPVAERPDPQEEIIETRLQPVPETGGVGDPAHCQPSLGVAGRDLPLATPAHVVGAAEAVEAPENGILVENLSITELTQQRLCFLLSFAPASLAKALHGEEEMVVGVCKAPRTTSYTLLRYI